MNVMGLAKTFKIKRLVTLIKHQTGFGVSLITPGHPRIPHDTPGHINTLKDTFIRPFLLCFFLNQIRFI